MVWEKNNFNRCLLSTDIDVLLRCGIESESESEGHLVMPTLRDPIDYTVSGILQARILEWVVCAVMRVHAFLEQ